MMLNLRTELVEQASGMTGECLGAGMAAACVPYWRHGLSPLSGRLREAEGRLLTQLVWRLSPRGSRPAIVGYMALEDLPAEVEVLTERTFDRGWLISRRRVLRVVSCSAPSVFMAVLCRAWEVSGNETLLVAMGHEASVMTFVRTQFADNVEANPVNEEGLLPLVPAILSRGWDGQTASILSRSMDAAVIGAAMQQCSGDGSGTCGPRSV